jgi:hypothetical protein|tara:strand:+ start:25173 stop:25592 length:420 start_codon:yes stop_codon:yes gene_type:complete
MTQSNRTKETTTDEICPTCDGEGYVEVEAPDAEVPVEETLELLADMMDHQDKVHVIVFPSLLREAAETIKSLREDVINITSMDGEHIATIDGPLASEIYVVAVKEFIEKAIENAMRDDIERVGDVGSRTEDSQDKTRTL